MKSQWLVNAVVAIAFLGFMGWIASQTYWDDAYVPMPLRGEAAQNKFYAAQRLSESLGAPTQWRRTLGELPATDAVLVLSDWNWGLIAHRREQLEQWVERGGQLVLDSSFIDGDGSFEAWSGLYKETEPGLGEEEDESDSAAQEDASDEEGESVETDDNEPADDPSSYAGTPAWRAACGDLQVANPAPDNEKYATCTLDPLTYLRTDRKPLWALLQGQRTQVLRVALGRGAVTLINAQPFGNRDLLEADHAVLFAAATRLHPGAMIVFLSEEQYASLLELIWMYGAPALLLALLLLAAALWRNGARFGPPAGTTDRARRSLAEQIAGTGQFTLRVGGGKALHTAMVRAVHEAAARRIAGYDGMSQDSRVESIAKLTDSDALELAATINYAGARRSREMKHAIEMLERVRRRLLIKDRVGEIAHAG